MAHHEEPMDIDSDFDNKENSLHHSNVLPFTEKGYEELDVSELNMKLRYSITPASSPMSKSYTANCVDNKSLELSDDTLNVTINENSNLTRSLNSNMTKNDNVVKSLKALPLQAISTEQFVDSNRNASVLRPLDTTVPPDNANITVTVSGPGDIDENLSLLSSSSSAVQTPEATTPTKDNIKNDGGSSPIMRGIKTVLNMFRSSQSPIPPADSENNVKPDILSPTEATLSAEDAKTQVILASTPISSHRKKETSPTKRNSPHKDSIVFNEDLEKELQWKDETTIIFSQERIPIHKLFFQHSQPEMKNTNLEVKLPTQEVQDDMNSTVEYMDISYNDSFKDRTITDIEVMDNKTDCTFTGESDGEFVDCETTFTKNDSFLDDKDKTPVNEVTQNQDLTRDIESTNENTSASRLKQIILNTTQDILDATLSITPEDLLPEALLKTQEKPGQDILDQILGSQNTEGIIPNEIELGKGNETINSNIFVETHDNFTTSQENLPVLNQTVDVTSIRVDVPLKEESNVTKTLENVEITKTEFEKEPIVTKKMETESETITIGSQHIQGNGDSTASNKTFVSNEKSIEDLKSQSTNNSNLIYDITQDNEPNKTGLDTSSVCNPSNLVEGSIATIYNPETLEIIVNKSLFNPDDEIKSSPIKEASMTELAAEVPLPDEDDLDKELSMPADITEATSSLNSLPLDLVDDIKVQAEILEIIDNATLEEEQLKLEIEEYNDDKTVLSLHLNPSNFERGDNIHNEFDPELIRVTPEVIKDIDVKNEELPLTEEPQVVTVDVLPETAPSLNIDTETGNNMDHMQYNVEIMHRTETVTECLNTTETYNTEESLRLNQPMDINESVIGLKPLPDIINQTNIVPSVENFESAQSIPATVMLEQSTVLPDNLENVANEVINPENVAEAGRIVVPELLSDVSEIAKPGNELTNVFKEELAINLINEELAMVSATDGTKTFVTENVPVPANSVIDGQLNNVDVISTEPAMSDNDKEPIGTNVPVGECAVIKTEDDEILLSENNSPFVSVSIAEDIPGMEPEVTINVQNIDHRSATPGRVVFTPPASPPIASKGYNFNFDEIDDPFATKTKIRVSPSMETPTKTVEPKASSRSVQKPMPKREITNRRKSQPERKKPVAPKRKFNTSSDIISDKTTESSIKTFSIGDMNIELPVNVALEPKYATLEDKLIEEAKLVHEITLNVAEEVHKLQEINPKDEIEPKDEIKPEEEIEQFIITSFPEVIKTDEFATIISNDSKSTLSSEKSAYYSASPSESLHTRNVFNIPEIDDKNFNPFATKSKMRQSPPPDHMENPFATKTKIRHSPESSMIVPQNDEIVNAQETTITLSPNDKMETEFMEKDGSENLSNTTTSSKATDEKNATIKEVNTEDEDTIEGPFLEAEDLNTDDKMSDFDGENIDMMQFNDLPTRTNEENLDNGELFIDAEAFEFLLNQNKSNTVVDSGKESLFLKFDPLFAKRMSSITSESLIASLNKIQKRQSTPTKAAMPEKEDKSSIPGPSNLNITQDMDITHNKDMTHNSSEELNEDLNITVSKPMMVVPPAVNPVTPRNKSLTPNRSNRRSITFTSPAMAVIDRLLSLSGNSSPMHDTTVTHAIREQNDADLVLTELRELLAEKEINVYSLRSESKELTDRLTSLESHLKSLESVSQERLKKINDLNDRLADKTRINKSMAAVVEEYERTIASLISEIAQDKKRHAEERIKLINERDEQTAHLASMEVSFSDLHSKYEKSKQVILNCKANEDSYKKSIKAFEENLAKMQNNYELLKQHATSKLNHANQELEKMNKTHEADVLKLNAMIKRKDLHITSLEESLAQKTKANEELTAICDELINKVG